MLLAFAAGVAIGATFVTLTADDEPIEPSATPALDGPGAMPDWMDSSSHGRMMQDR
ncbi:hypothetical protein [Aeromicrobium sp. CF3.5]|uniref:hypothetical protein n=1 Tax=Aeromicrobium sp. CF3.5 TaxID=3373078 RepID=UPI003EE67C43